MYVRIRSAHPQRSYTTLHYIYLYIHIKMWMYWCAPDLVNGFRPLGPVCEIYSSPLDSGEVGLIFLSPGSCTHARHLESCLSIVGLSRGGWRATLSLPFLNEVLLVMTLLNNSWFFCFPKESDIMRGKNRVLRVIHWWSSFFLFLGGVTELRIFSLTDAYFTKGAPIRWGLCLCYCLYMLKNV